MHVKLGQKPKVQGCCVFSEPEIPQQSRGCMILVKNDIEEPILCREGVEIQAVKLYLADTTFVCYNIYGRHAGMLKRSQLMLEAANGKVFIGGDFNTNHHRLESPSQCNRSGIHVMQTIDEMLEVRLLNREPTHRDGGRLDLSFITEELYGAASWEAHPTLTSDHFAVQISLTLSKMPPPPLPPKRWNHSKVDWHKFKHSVDEWITTYQPADDINQLEKDLVEALQNAADASVQVVVPTSHQQKDNWYYCPEIKELNARINRVHKIFRRNPTEENYEHLKEVATHVSTETDAIRHDKWLEWCTSLNEHISIGNLWHDLRRIAGKRTATGRHQEPLEEANRLAGVFSGRTSTENLPPATMRMQERFDEGRWERLEAACYLPDDTDCPFTIEELRRCKHKGKDTAPGADGISYSMIVNMGPGAEILFLGLINKTWDERKRLMAWNDQDFQPIPKPKDPMNTRTIALLSVLGKNAEKNGFSKSKMESERTTHQFVCVHRRKKYNSMYNGHLNDSEQQKSHCLIPGFGKSF